ncbi:hypothetical protein C8R45DRAFT_1040930 [Mycena sanguinolenta]|nr:hypothetical protein C8R45DRAFT_1040930 [Mycena sanguinolenta]
MRRRAHTTLPFCLPFVLLLACSVLCVPLWPVVLPLVRSGRGECATRVAGATHKEPTRDAAVHVSGLGSSRRRVR